MKIYIKRNEKKPDHVCIMLTTYISFDGIKPYDMNELEWGVIKSYVEKIKARESKCYTDIKAQECWFDIYLIEDEKEWGILAESEHYFIVREYEDASIYRKSDSKRITCVGDFYGNPEDAYIDPEERFCITVGCGIIKYNIQEPFEGYMYDQNTPQWIEVGREGDNIEWCDKIEEVTDSYIIVSLEGEERRRFNLTTLNKEDIL